MTCSVCCEPFNRSNHSRIVCRYCPYETCSTCAERYLLDTPEDPHCMNCRRGWTREVLVENFTQKFVIRTFKARREALLLERERSLMPATQPYVEIEKKIRTLTKHIGQIRHSIEKANENWANIANLNLNIFMVRHGIASETEALILQHKLGSDQRKVVSDLMIDIQHLEWCQNLWINRLHGNQVEIEKRQFVRACPYADCRGFLSTAWKCGMCENWVCPDCHEGRGPTKDAEHTCDPNNVATAQLLARDSRNCPKCASLIFKINGCDQMYCTQCHTAFSWRTGRVETGQIHNPHYYDYMRQHGTLPRNPGDVPCGGLADWTAIARHLKRDEFWNKIAGAHRSWGHCRWVLIPRYTIDNNADNRDLRIKLMIGDITEDEFKRKIQQREKARQRKTDIRQVLDMYQAVLVDVFQVFSHDKVVPDLVTALDELKNHVNTTLRAVSHCYSKCAVPFINENLEFR